MRQQLPQLDCDWVIARLEAYLAGTLPLEELHAIADHLEACLTCMHRLALRRASFLVLASAPDAETA